MKDGRAAFSYVVDRIKRAKRSIDVRAFVWQDDDTGQELARAVVEAADRGVNVSIWKDQVAANYEYWGGNGQSLFHKDLTAHQRFEVWFISVAYRVMRKGPQRPSLIADRIRRHPCIQLFDGSKRFDHAKLFQIDDAALVIGSMGIADHHRNVWFDLMVALEGPQHTHRLGQRLGGHVPFDPRREVDFLVFSRETHGKGPCALRAERMSLIDGARSRLTIAMAYLGDRRFRDALLRALSRGVDVTLLTSAQADILGDLNKRFINDLMEQASGAGDLRVVLHPGTVHAKIVVVDGAVVDLGSANFTSLSHGVYEEVDVYVRRNDFAAKVEALIHSRCSEGQVAQSGIKYRRWAAHIEGAVVRYQSRHAL